MSRYRFTLRRDASEELWLDCNKLAISADGYGISFWVINGAWWGTIYPNGFMVVDEYPDSSIDLRSGFLFDYREIDPKVSEYHNTDLDDGIPF